MDQEQTLQQLEELRAQNEQLQAEVGTLKQTKSGLLADLAKVKSVKRLLVAANIDPDASEDQIAAALASRSRREPPADQQESRSPEPAPASQQRPSGDPSGPEGSADAMTKASLDSLTRQVEELTKRLSTAEQEKDDERQLRRKERARSVALAIMEEAQVKPPQRETLLKVLETQGMINYVFETDESGAEVPPAVLFGDNDNPKTFKDGLVQLSGEEAWEGFFIGNSPSGSGLPGSRSSISATSTSLASSTNNPFVKPGNATQAAIIYNRDPRQAKRLYDQAKATGKLDRIVAKVIERTT